MSIPHLDLPPAYKRIAALAERCPRRAVQVAQRALQRVPADDLLLQAWATFTLGWALLRWERLPAARARLEQAHATFVAANEFGAALDCRRALLLAAMLGGAGASLQAEWQSLADEYITHSAPLAAARTQLQQIEHLTMLVRSREAQELAEAITPLILTEGLPADQAMLWRVQASIASDCGQLDQALTHITTAEQLFTSVPSPLEVARCRLKRAWLHQRREAFDQAQSDLEAALAVFRQLDLPLHCALAERNHGITALLQGRYDQALAMLYYARTRLVELGRDDVVADCDLSLGNIAYYTGQYDLARGHYRRAQHAYVDQGSAYLSLLSQRNQALALRAQGQSAAALQLLRSIEQPVRDLGDALELAEVLHAQAQALIDLQHYAAALTCLEQAHTWFIAGDNYPAAAETVLEQGWARLALVDPTAASHCFRTARTALADRPAHVWRAEYGLGRCAQAQGDDITALDYYCQASTTMVNLRRKLASEHASSGLFTQARPLYANALRLTVALGDAWTALMLAEQQRALALQQQMAQVDVHIPTTLQQAYATQRVRLVALLNNAVNREQLDALLTDYLELLLQLRHSVPVPSSLPAALPALPHLRAQLTRAYPAGWTLVSYVEIGDQLLTISITAAAMTLTSQPFDARLHDLLKKASLKKYRDYIYCDLPRQLDPQRPPWHDLTDLSDRLIPPLARANLHPDRRLLIVPGGPLHALPWAALRIDDAWLCQRAIIELLPALALWGPPVALLHHDRSSAPEALLLGCSQFGEREQPLAHMRQELDLVAQHWPGPVTRWEDMNATRQAMRTAMSAGQLRRYRLLHLTSHAQLVASRGVLAHVKLWDDDLLHDEITGLGLEEALVVLAVCDGAASEVLPGDEVLSLSHAFIAGGAHTVVASLWPFYDRAPHRVMNLFYAALAAGVDAPTALAQSQRAAIDQAQASGEPVAIEYAPLVWGGLIVTCAGAVRR